MKNTKKTANKLPVPGKVREGFRFYCAAVLSIALLLGWGIVQVGLSFQSHDPSQRSNGFLTLAGGIVITFAKEILNLITG